MRVTIEGDALRLLLVEREALKTLEKEWDSVGVYLLIGKPSSEEASLSVYIGKAQALRSRIKTGHNLKDWERCLLIQREGLHPFNASDISWLERRLIDVLLEAPAIDLVNKTPPPPELCRNTRLRYSNALSSPHSEFSGCSGRTSPDNEQSTDSGNSVGRFLFMPGAAILSTAALA